MRVHDLSAIMLIAEFSAEAIDHVPYRPNGIFEGRADCQPLSSFGHEALAKVSSMV